MQPLLGLVMIVKNEARGIADTLASVVPYVDRWTILDTGSTDGTQDLIRKHAGLDGTLYEEPFVDYATTRNRVLDLHGQATTFTLMLSGDDVLHGGAELRTFLTRELETTTEIYNIEREHGTDRFETPVVLRASAIDWRFVGRTHEVLTKPGHFSTVAIPAVRITRPRDVPRESKRPRWEQDLLILHEDVERDPTNSRAMFYLAQTYECLDRYQEALRYYEHRIEMGGWPEEVYAAIFRAARCLAALRAPWPFIEARYLQAHSYDPRRAEPLYEIAAHWRACENLALTYLFASRAAALPQPPPALFTDVTVYEYKAAELVTISAYHLGRRLNDAAVLAVGHRAAEAVVRARPDDPQAHANLQSYLQLTA